jgi:SAM-dependent methyltransferase
VESIASSNSDQLAAWDGDRGQFWAEHAYEFERAIGSYRERFFRAAAIRNADRVLDVGCGTGQTTCDAARLAAAGSALGVDLSSQLLALAEARAAREELSNVRFEQADAQVYPFPDDAFDIAISRNGTMFFGDPVAAFTNIARALTPAGRLVLQTWQPVQRNEFAYAPRAALAAGRDLPVLSAQEPGPFALSDPDRVRSILTAAGFAVISIDDVREPMNFGTDPDEAFRYLSAQHAGMLEDLEAEARDHALRNLQASVREHHTNHGVRYGSAAWLITASKRA